jgi:hypothetical protein
MAHQFVDDPGRNAGILQPGGVGVAKVMGAVLRRPGKAAQLLGGSAGVTLAYALTLASCLAAFGAHVPLVSTIAVYLAGAAVASISPTPGGGGAMEAALVAGLTAVGAPAGPAVAAVLARAMLGEHRDALDRLTELLLERETVDGTDVDGVLGRIPGQHQPIGATGHAAATDGPSAADA